MWHLRKPASALLGPHHCYLVLQSIISYIPFWGQRCFCANTLKIQWLSKCILTNRASVQQNNMSKTNQSPAVNINIIVPHPASRKYCRSRVRLWSPRAARRGRLPLIAHAFCLACLGLVRLLAALSFPFPCRFLASPASGSLDSPHGFTPISYGRWGTGTS